MKSKLSERELEQRIVEKVRYVLREFKFEPNFSNLDQDLVRLRNILAREGVRVERTELLPQIRRLDPRRSALLGQIYEILADRPKQSDPPKLAECLLTTFLKPSHADAVTGDLNEHFTGDCEIFGRPRAVRLYWARTLRSLWPLLRRAIGRALKWGAVIATVRRLF